MLFPYLKKLPKKWTRRAHIFLALGDEHRQRILLMFKPGEELTIKDIADACPLSRTAVAHHLRVLREAGVLLERKEGRCILLRPDGVAIAEAMKGVLEYIGEDFQN